MEYEFNKIGTKYTLSDELRKDIDELFNYVGRNMSMDMGSIMGESDVPSELDGFMVDLRSKPITIAPSEVVIPSSFLEGETTIESYGSPVRLDKNWCERNKKLETRIADLEKYTDELAQYIKVLQDVTVALTMKSNDQAEALHKLNRPTSSVDSGSKSVLPEDLK